MRLIGAVPALALVLGGACALLFHATQRSRCLRCSSSRRRHGPAWWQKHEIERVGRDDGGVFCAAAALAADAQRRALHPSFGPQAEPVACARAAAGGCLAAGRVHHAAGNVTGVRARRRMGAGAGAGVTMTVGGSVTADRAVEWRAGRIVETFATFRRPARYLNEGVPDFERDLALAGTALLRIDQERPARGGSRARARRAGGGGAIRAHVRRSVARWVAPHDAVAAAIVTAVLIGDRTGLPDDIRVRLQAAGTYHVIAISGGNIAILAGLVFGLLLLVGFSGRPAAFITLLVLVAYAQVVSAGPSVWRATLMAVLYLGARLLDHRSPPWHALAVAAAIVICARPLDVRDAGFMLTFGATAGAARRGAARGAGACPARRRTAALPQNSWLAAGVAGGLAGRGDRPPADQRWTFSRVTSAGLVLNLAAVPLMALVQVGGIVVSCVAMSRSSHAGRLDCVRCGGGAGRQRASGRRRALADGAGAAALLVVIAAYYAGLASRSSRAASAAAAA